MQINGTVKHTAASRLNAYNAVLRFYFPPYAEYIQNSFEKVNEKFSTAEVTHYKINSRNELQVKVSGFYDSLFTCKDSSVIESPALRNSKRRNHEVKSHREEGPGHCLISKTFLNVQISTLDI